MTTCLGKSCSFGLPCVPFVNCGQFMYLVISLLVLRAGYGIWLYQFLIIAYLFTFQANQVGRNMTKPAKWHMHPPKTQTSAQSDQSLCCPYEESLGPQLLTECTEKTLIRLGRYPDWSESSLAHRPYCWFCSRGWGWVVFPYWDSSGRCRAKAPNSQPGRS